MRSLLLSPVPAPSSPGGKQLTGFLRSPREYGCTCKHRDHRLFFSPSGSGEHTALYVSTLQESSDSPRDGVRRHGGGGGVTTPPLMDTRLFQILLGTCFVSDL